MTLRPSRLGAIVTLVAVAAGGLAVLGVAPSAEAAPGKPGVPSAPTVLYDEDFQNAAAPSTVQRLTDYTGPTGQKYTADAAWLTNCNGWIASTSQSATAAGPVADCRSQLAWNSTQQLASALGQFRGQSAAESASNYAVSAYTSANPGANRVEFRTVNNIPFATPNRYVAFSVDVAANNCAIASAPSLQFALVRSDSTAVNVGTPVNACTSTTSIGTTRVGTYSSNGSLLFTGSSLGIRMVNANGSGSGNDHAFDNIRIIDATPQLDKQFTPATGVRGEPSNVTFTITNTSELASKNGWSFSDDLPTGMTVAGAGSTTCSAGVIDAAAGNTNISIQGNLNAGQASCTVTVPVVSSVTGPLTNLVDDVTTVGLIPPADATITYAGRAPAISLVKRAAVTPAADQDAARVGDTIAYSFAVTNSGNVALPSVTVDDPQAGAVTCPAGTLAAGATVTCTADEAHTVTQADVEAGSVVNTATATGTDRTGVAVTSNRSSATVPTLQNAALTLVKSATPNTAAEYTVGQRIDYSFLVTNTGTVRATDVGIVEDEFTGSNAPSDVFCPEGATALAPGESVTCTSSYTLTQADINRGTTRNTAHATGNTVTGRTESPNSGAIVPVEAGPAITVEKTATPTTVTAAGDDIRYSFVVTNTGNVTLTGVGVAEGTFTGTGIPSDILCPLTTLPSGQATTCTSTYTATQADVDAGVIRNTATATGTPPTGDPVTSTPSSAEVTATSSPAITVEKTATPTAVTTAGQTVDYKFVVTNTGNVTLTDPTVNEGSFTGTGTLSAVDCPTGPLAPGAAVTCTATYDATQADVNRGTIANTATATGTPPSGDPVTSTRSTATVTADSTPAIALRKSATPGTITGAGQTIAYSFVITNSGNVTLTDPTVNEGAFTGSGDLGAVGCPAGALAPDASITCTADYTVTQADVNRGSIDNTATATGTPPTGDAVTSARSSARVSATAVPGLSVVKSVSPSSDADFTVGQELTYSFVVTNTGNVTMRNPGVDDQDFSGTGTLTPVDCPSDAALAPGDQLTCTATYTLTQGDIDRGSVTNAATATGTPPSGELFRTPPSRVIVPQAQNPAISLEKSADRASVTAAGDTITYSFLVTNTGNVTLTDPEITEGDFSGTGNLSAVGCPAAAPLLPGQQETCAATYTVTQADVDAGDDITNTATATATPPAGLTAPVSDPSNAAVTVDATAAIALAKTGTAVDTDKSGRITAVDQVRWVITVTNSGTTTLDDVAVDDPKGGTVTCPVTTIAPGDSVDCTVALHTITADEQSARIATNTATVTANGVTGTVTTDPATARVPVTVPAPPTTTPPATTPPATPPAGGTGSTPPNAEGPDGGLAFTGATLWQGSAAAAALLLAGLVVTILRRRRRPEEE